jgi:transcription elongation factor Elf1
MGLDAERVRDAEAARRRLIESQHAVERARADYHHAIRRLHAAGGSLREIAEVLRLSHQRVHQIIGEAAEPTRRRWRREPQRLQGPAGPCSFCGRSRTEVAKLIAGPGVFICDQCAAHVTRLSPNAPLDDRVDAPMRLEPPDSQFKCSFCGKQARQVGFLAASGLAGAPGGKFGQGARICDECLDLCLEILAETASS